MLPLTSKAFSLSSVKILFKGLETYPSVLQLTYMYFLLLVRCYQKLVSQKCSDGINIKAYQCWWLSSLCDQCWIICMFIARSILIQIIVYIHLFLWSWKSKSWYTVLNVMEGHTVFCNTWSQSWCEKMKPQKNDFQCPLLRRLRFELSLRPGIMWSISMVHECGTSCGHREMTTMERKSVALESSKL